jgi:hypothetical protein
MSLLIECVRVEIGNGQQESGEDETKGGLENGFFVY